MKIPGKKLSLISAALCGQLLSQTGYAAPALEEVIVTAEKREETLRDVPISIAAFTEETLENLGITDLKSIAANVPNLAISEFTGSPTTIRMFIRGVGQNDVQVTQDPSVALYMDGVYIGSSAGTAFDSADLQRVEVLRGPQGTLYGRNATGGALNLITHRADPEAFTFRQTLSAGNFDYFRSRTIANIPLSDSVAVKLAYSTFERDGLVENLGNGEDWGIEDRDNFTADLHWGLNDRHVLDYKYERSTIEDTTRLSQVLNYDDTASSSFVSRFENPELDPMGNPVEVGSKRLDKATSFDEEVRGDIEIEGHTLTYDWDVSDQWRFKSISAFRELDDLNQTAQSPTTSLLGVYSVTNGRTGTSFEQLTQEFQFLLDGESISWVTGLFYYEDESEVNSFGESNGSEGIPEGDLVDFTSTENSSLAIYSQATWTPESLGGAWHLTLGGRYSQDNRKAYRANNRVSYGFGGSESDVPAFVDNYDKDFSKLNPSFTVEYDLSEVSNVYAKVVTAYKSGGTSQRSTSSSNFRNGFDEEDLTSYEFGYKGLLLDQRLSFNAAVFYMDFEGYQQSVQTGRAPGERDFVNIDEATIGGLEIDITVAITERLTGTLGYGYLDTEFKTDSVNFLRVDDDAPGGLIEVNETLTDELAMAPQNSLAFSLDYRRSLSIGQLSANINYQFRDETLSGITFPVGTLTDYQLLGANLGLSEIALGKSAGHIKLSVWGKNLLDEEYHIGNIRQGGFDDLGLIGLATFGDPRTYGVTVEYSYD